jgi:acyl-[acyl carrier protein]--UDP-N-acetylglucosamine O-acyltransferase
MLPKQKSYIPRFALLIHVFNAIGNVDYDFYTISKESLLKAEKLSKYFIAMAKKVKMDSVEITQIRKVLKANDNKTTKEKFKILYDANKDLNVKEISEQLGVSVQMIYKYKKEVGNE